jgi:ParB family chromosome partitioning protein
MAGLERVPVHVLSEGEGKDLELALLENVQREDLSPLEVAEGLEKLAARPGMTQQKIADAMGWSRSAVANKLRLLQLPEEIRLMLAEGALAEGHCRALLGLDEREAQIAIARRAAARGASVRQTELWVRQSSRQPARTEEEKPDPLADRCEQLSRKLGIRLGISGRGKRKKLVLSRMDDRSLWELLNLLEERSGELFPGK